MVNIHQEDVNQLNSKHSLPDFDYDIYETESNQSLLRTTYIIYLPLNLFSINNPITMKNTILYLTLLLTAMLSCSSSKNVQVHYSDTVNISLPVIIDSIEFQGTLPIAATDSFEKDDLIIHVHEQATMTFAKNQEGNLEYKVHIPEREIIVDTFVVLDTVLVTQVEYVEKPRRKKNSLWTKIKKHYVLTIIALIVFNVFMIRIFPSNRKKI